MEPSDAFLLIYRGLARHAPGTDDATLEALAACELPDEPVVYDLGAGTGSSTLVLAEQLESKVIAVDQLDQSLGELTTRAERRGIDGWVEARDADFMALDIAPGSVDLIWSEGAIYGAGWDAALETWGGWLGDGGYLVVTDCVWATDAPPDEAREFWDREYPDMSDEQTLRGKATAAGFEVVKTFPLPPHAWSDYYGPLTQRVALVRSGNPSDEMQAVVSSIEDELSIWERHGHAVDYVFFVMRK